MFVFFADPFCKLFFFVIKRNDKKTIKRNDKKLSKKVDNLVSAGSLLKSKQKTPRREKKMEDIERYLEKQLLLKDVHNVSAFNANSGLGGKVLLMINYDFTKNTPTENMTVATRNGHFLCYALGIKQKWNTKIDSFNLRDRPCAFVCDLSWNPTPTLAVHCNKAANLSLQINYDDQLILNPVEFTSMYLFRHNPIAITDKHVIEMFQNILHGINDIPTFSHDDILRNAMYSFYWIADHWYTKDAGHSIKEELYKWNRQPTQDMEESREFVQLFAKVTGQEKYAVMTEKLLTMYRCSCGKSGNLDEGGFRKMIVFDVNIEQPLKVSVNERQSPIFTKIFFQTITNLIVQDPLHLSMLEDKLNN